MVVWYGVVGYDHMIRAPYIDRTLGQLTVLCNEAMSCFPVIVMTQRMRRTG